MKVDVFDLGVVSTRGGGSQSHLKTGFGGIVTGALVCSPPLGEPRQPSRNWRQEVSSTPI